MISLCLLLVTCSIGQAAGVEIAEEIHKLTSEADLVIRAKVKQKTVLRDAGSRIYTEVELIPQQGWKGLIPLKTVPLVHPGGVLGEEVSLAAGQPDYPVGEENLLFLVQNSSGKYVTLGLGRGKFQIQQVNGAEVVTQAGKLPVQLKQIIALIQQSP